MGQEIEEIVANEENEEILGYDGQRVVGGRGGQEIEEIVSNEENEEML